MEEFYNALEDVVSCVCQSTEYQNCLNIREKMSNNSELVELIQNIKKVQKQYIRSNYDKELKRKLDDMKNQLEQIPIYVVYLQNLNIVNEKIEYIKDSLNDYFYQLFNE